MTDDETIAVRSSFPVRSSNGRSFVVSIDHFRHEMISQLRRAAAKGATSIVITSRELCQSIRMGKSSTNACCEAMQAEMKPGDVLVDQSSGAGSRLRLLKPSRSWWCCSDHATRRPHQRLFRRAFAEQIPEQLIRATILGRAKPTSVLGRRAEDICSS
jgi:hypothetical protein